MRVNLSKRSDIEETLFRFLLSVREKKPWAVNPLISESGELDALFVELNPDLSKVLHHCVDAILVDLTPDPGKWEAVSVTASALAMAIAAHNCLALVAATELDNKEGRTEVVLSFTSALIDTIPMASDLGSAMTYHSILCDVADVLPRLKPQSRRLLHELIELSPITAMRSLDVYTPAALRPIAAELLPGWRAGNDEHRQRQGWLDAVINFLSNPHIARWMRHQWIAIPETRLACRNLGLLLEALRRANQRSVVLEFYESYEVLCAQNISRDGNRVARAWPIVETIGKLLRVSGDSEVAIEMNRMGNEYFLKFRPLLEIVIQEKVVPTDYAMLSGRFVMALRPLVSYITENVRRQRINLDHVRFDT